MLSSFFSNDFNGFRKRPRASKLLVFLFSLGLACSSYAAKILVTDTGSQPIANAKIIVGTGENLPFQGNVLFTDEKGQVDVPESWDPSLPFQISAQGYLKAVYIGSYPTLTHFQLSQEDSRERIEVRGDAVEFGNLKRDGLVDFALVYPAFRYNQLARFDINSVLSPEIDTIKVIKEIRLPSNVSLPKQKESYFLPVELDKPAYRFRVKQKGDYKMIAARGQFPLKKVVDDLTNGKSLFEVMKHFVFLGGGEKDLSAEKSLSGQDIPVNQMVFENTVSTRAPNLPNDTTMLSIAVATRDGYNFVTDIKKLESNESANLKIVDKRDSDFIMSLLFTTSQLRDFGANAVEPPEAGASANGSESAPSGELPNLNNAGFSLARHAEGSIQPEFLSLIAKPELNGDTVKSKAPIAIANFVPVSTRYLLSEIELPSTGIVDFTIRVLEGVQMGWTETVTIPGLAAAMEKGKKYKLEVIYSGRLTNHKKQAEYDLDDVTHVTRNSITL